MPTPKSRTSMTASASSCLTATSMGCDLPEYLTEFDNRLSKACLRALSSKRVLTGGDGNSTLITRPSASAEWRKTSTVAATAAHKRSEEHTSELQSLRHLVCRL